MSRSTRLPAAHHRPDSTTLPPPSDDPHRCGNCGSVGLRTVALICAGRDCGETILDDTTTAAATLRSEAALKHTCSHCGKFGHPIEMLACSGCSTPVRVEQEPLEVANGAEVDTINAYDETRQNVSVTIDDSTANEQMLVAEASTESHRLLKLAPEYFKLAVVASGVSAVVAGEIERKELYGAEGFSSFRDYAEKKLGISSDSAFKKLRQAARAVWEFYPERAKAVLKALQADGHARVHDLPEVPDETKLYLLKRAHKNAPEQEWPHLLKKTLNGTCTTRQLEEMARLSRNAKLPQGADQHGKRRGIEIQTAEQAQTASRAAPTPPTQAKQPVAATQVPPGPTTPTDFGNTVHTPPHRADDAPDADEASVNGQDLLSRAFWGLDTACDALSRLAPGAIKADRLSALRALLDKTQRALEDHEGDRHE